MIWRAGCGKNWWPFEDLNSLHQVYLQRDVCFSAFAVFDVDGDGRITLDELKQLLDSARVKWPCSFIFFHVLSSAGLLRESEIKQAGNYCESRWLWLRVFHGCPVSLQNTSVSWASQIDRIISSKLGIHSPKIKHLPRNTGSLWSSMESISIINHFGSLPLCMRNVYEYLYYIEDQYIMYFYINISTTINIYKFRLPSLGEYVFYGKWIEQHEAMHSGFWRMEPSSTCSREPNRRSPRGPSTGAPDTQQGGAL